MAILDKVDLLANIAADIADNTTRDITAADVRDNLTDLVDSLHGVYGLLTVVANATPQSVTTTPARITAWSANGLSNGTTPDHATNNGITVGTDGIYLVHFSADVLLAAALWTLNLAENTTLQSTLQWVYDASGATETTAVIIGLISSAANDLISVYATSDEGGGADIVVKQAQLVLHRIA